MNDALGRRRDDRQPDLLKRISGLIQHLTKLGRYIAAVDALLAGRGDDVARRHRFQDAAALEGVGRAMEPPILMRVREIEALTGLGVGLSKLEQIARTHHGNVARGAAEAVEVRLPSLATGRRSAGRHSKTSSQLEE